FASRFLSAKLGAANVQSAPAISRVLPAWRVRFGFIFSILLPNCTFDWDVIVNVPQTAFSRRSPALRSLIVVLAPNDKTRRAFSSVRRGFRFRRFFRRQ